MSREGAQGPLRISVAMCTYNGERFLRRQLESISEQTLLPDELVVYDDGSTDGTLALLRDFALRSNIPTFVHSNDQTLGVVSNFEAALGHCRGQLLFLADQDDVWLPRRVEQFVHTFAVNPDALLVFSDARLVDADEAPLPGTLWQSLAFGEREQRAVATPKGLSLLLHKSVVTGAASAVRRSLLPLARPFPRDIGLLHDGWLALVASCWGTVVASPEPSICYRQHAAQFTGAPQRPPSEAGSQALADARRHYDYALQERQATLLLERLSRADDEGLSVTGQPRVDDLISHLKHLQARLQLGRRPAPGLVLRELAAGRYHRHSNGFRSALKDALLTRPS